MECGNSLVKEVVSAAAPAVEKAAESSNENNRKMYNTDD
jgi:hypothetical protein